MEKKTEEKVLAALEGGALTTAELLEAVDLVGNRSVLYDVTDAMKTRGLIVRDGVGPFAIWRLA